MAVEGESGPDPALEGERISLERQSVDTVLVTYAHAPGLEARSGGVCRLIVRKRSSFWCGH